MKKPVKKPEPVTAPTLSEVLKQPWTFKDLIDQVPISWWHTHVMIRGQKVNSVGLVRDHKGNAIVQLDFENHHGF